MKVIPLFLFLSISILALISFNYFRSNHRIKNQITLSKKAIIIGASSGIGEATARELAKRGYTVGLTARRCWLLEAIKKDIKTACFIEKMDVSKPEEAQLILKSLIAKMGGVDIIIISAGTGNCCMTWEKQKEIIDVNIVGFTALATTAIDYFMAKNSGHLMGLSSIVGLRPFADSTVYSASKSYISFYLNGLREKLKRLDKNITITEIQPGLVDTMMGRCSDFWRATPEKATVQICDALEQKKDHAYITKRWRLIAWIFKLLPDWLFYKIL